MTVCGALIGGAGADGSGDISTLRGAIRPGSVVFTDLGGVTLNGV